MAVVSIDWKQIKGFLKKPIRVPTWLVIVVVAVVIISFIALIIPKGPTLTGEIRYIKARTLNVRGGPGLGYKIVTQVKLNDPVQKLKLSGTWCKIKTTKGKIGWVNKKFLGVSPK